LTGQIAKKPDCPVKNWTPGNPNDETHLIACHYVVRHHVVNIPQISRYRKEGSLYTKYANVTNSQTNLKKTRNRKHRRAAAKPAACIQPLIKNCAITGG